MLLEALLITGILAKCQADVVTFNCEKLPPHQTEVDIQLMSGTWYGVEIIDHLIVERKHSRIVPGMDNVIKVDNCIKIDIGVPEKQVVSLAWMEKTLQVDYIFVTRLEDAGYWESRGAQLVSGSGSKDVKYEQFAGVLTITKAVRDHAILTFCSPGSKFYSLILLKKSRPAPMEMDTIHKTVLRTNVTVAGVRTFCNDAILISSSIPFTLALALILGNRM